MVEIYVADIVKDGKNTLVDELGLESVCFQTPVQQRYISAYLLLHYLLLHGLEHPREAKVIDDLGRLRLRQVHNAGNIFQLVEVVQLRETVLRRTYALYVCSADQQRLMPKSSALAAL